MIQGRVSDLQVNDVFTIPEEGGIFIYTVVAIPSPGVLMISWKRKNNHETLRWQPLVDIPVMIHEIEPCEIPL